MARRSRPDADSVAHMPSTEHDSLCELFRQRPSLAAEMLGDILGTRLPDYRVAHLRSETVTDDRLAERHADAVVEFCAAESGDKLFAVVVEIQLRQDRAKHYSWPFYLMGVRDRLKCDAYLLVVCLDRKTANWCSRTINLGHPGMTLTPIVLSPDDIPYVIDPAEAARLPELAVMSAMVHGRERSSGKKVLATLHHAYDALDAEHRTRYHAFVCDVLPKWARIYLEQQLSLTEYEYKNEFSRTHVAEGKRAARREDILANLEARGIEVSDEVRDRIMHCTDLDLLRTWHNRAATAIAVDELFD